MITTRSITAGKPPLVQAPEKLGVPHTVLRVLACHVGVGWYDFARHAVLYAQIVLCGFGSFDTFHGQQKK
jgi:hypothetical protein